VIFLVAAKQMFVNAMRPINVLAFSPMLCNHNTMFTNYTIVCYLFAPNNMSILWEISFKGLTSKPTFGRELLVDVELQPF
jgi:hypothetical protein